MKTEKIKLIEELEVLLEDHQKYIEVIKIFCTTSEVDKELNTAYLQTLKKITTSLKSPLLSKYKISLYKPFVGDLYTAESEWNEMNMILMREAGPVHFLSWETLKPFLYQTQSEITKILHEIKGDDIHIDVKKVIEERKTKNKILTEEITVGPLSYRDGVLYYKNSIIKGIPLQEADLCKVFLTYPNEFITYETIQNEISGNDFLSKENMQKLVSKLRSKLRKETKQNLIKSKSNKGYVFELEKLL